MTNEFKGTINGVDFDNVKDYNEYLQKLIQSGENINAQSSTNIVNSNTKTEKHNCCNNGSCENSGSCENKQIDGGYVPFFEDGDEYYLDDDSLGLDGIKNVFNKFGATISDKLDELCPCQLENYLNTISDICDSIESDDEFAKHKTTELEAAIKKNQDAITKLQEAIETAQSKQRRMEYFKEKIDVFNSFYQNLKDVVENRVEKRTNNCNCTCNCCGEDQSTKVIDTSKDPKYNILDGYTRLLKALLDVE